MTDMFPEPAPIDPQDQTYHTERDAKFIKLLEASGFDLAKREQIAVLAGFQPGMPAKFNAGRIIKGLRNNLAMQRAMKKQGIDNKRLAVKLDELLDCKHPAFPKQPDNMAQLKAADMCLKVKDAYPPTKVDIDKTETKQIVISGEVVARLERFNGIREIDATAIRVISPED